MEVNIKYRLSETPDLGRIRELLSAADLPVDDLDEGKVIFVVAMNEKNEIIGCIGVEKLGEEGLLRSMAVDIAYRGKGIAHELLRRLLSFSCQSGIHTIHLLTTTAEKFFDRAGFLLVSRSEAPDSIKTTSEFSSLCPASSAYMVMRDIQKQETYFPTKSSIN